MPSVGQVDDAPARLLRDGLRGISDASGGEPDEVIQKHVEAGG